MKIKTALLSKVQGREKGATVIEYALIAALISIAAIAAFSFIGTSVKSTMSGIGSAMSSATPT